MNQAFPHPADAPIATVPLPENVQLLAEQCGTASNESLGHINIAANGGVKLFDDLMATTQGTAKALGHKVLENATKNADAFFAAAGAMARAKSIHEVAALQVEYFQKQVTVACEQVRELSELSTSRPTPACERSAATTTTDRYAP